MTSMTTTTTVLPSAPATTVVVASENSPKNGMANRPHPSVYLTIDGLIRAHASEDADLPMVGYPAEGVSDFEVHTVKTIDRYVDAACQWYQQRGLHPADTSAQKAPVVALLTASGLDAIVSFFALNRLGWAVLFLSTRLAAPAYISLMKLADCNTIIAPPAFGPVVKDMQSQMDVSVLPRINSQDYRSAFNVQKFRRECDRTKESRKIAWIIHSSGSTGFPKPIFITNFGCLANWQKGLGFRSFTVSPLFHSHALMEFGRAVYAKRPMFFGNYAFPVTRQNLVAAMRVAQPEMVCAVPYVLKLLAEKEEGVAELAKAKIVMYGGSACPDALGDELTAKGVRLAGNYGATETGFIMNSFRPPEDKEWSYLRLHKPVADFVLMDEISPGVFECVALDGLPSKDTTNSQDPPNSFRTRDLFTRHPDPGKPNYWKYLSRLDDRLTLVNGEKVLPIPIEGHIRQHELIKEAAVFGVQRTVPGVILFKSEHAQGLNNEEFLDKVWPQIEEANRQAETFSHIPRDLVIVRPFDEVYPRTDKGTIIRAQLYAQYAEMIQQAYDFFENGPDTRGEANNLKQLDVAELEDFLMTKFRNDLHVELESPTDDIFSAGVDSLQTTRLWNIIKKEIDLGGSGAQLSQNVVFERGTVRSLAQHLHNLRMNIIEDAEAEDGEVRTMQDLINKYSNFTPHDSTGKPTVSMKTVLLTGVTGGLGSILLANLLKREDVARVYTLVRASNEESARGRVFASLSSRNLLSTIPAYALGKIIALPSDLSLPSLGLEEFHLRRMLAGLTHIIHSAWAVNFNIPLLAFEQQHIRGVYNMIEHIALRTTHSKPASFYFCSSISAASGTPKPATVSETQVENLAYAQHMGYGRSKLVSERVTAAAMKATDMQSRVLRIGQLAGDSVNAVWNDTEAIPLMVRSALSESAGCLPSLDEQPSWLPVDQAALTIEELVFSPGMEPEDAGLVYHVLNPRTFSFRHELLPMLQSHPDMPKFHIVSPREWLDRLHASDGDLTKNPSKKLMDFFEKKYGHLKHSQNDLESNRSASSTGLTFDTTATVGHSASLRQVQDPIRDGLMSRIISVWMKKWKAELEVSR